MKPKRIFSLILLLAVVGFGVFGAANHLSYPETTANPDYMDQLQVATLSQDGCDIVLQNMQQELPQSPIILRVTHKWYSTLSMPLNKARSIWFFSPTRWKLSMVLSLCLYSSYEAGSISTPSFATMI